MGNVLYTGYTKIIQAWNNMHRHLITDLLKDYFAEDPAEQEDKAKMLDFISREPQCFERGCQDGHFTGSCWLEDFRGSAALLTHHKKFNEWLQLGGHADGDNDLLQVALKEAQEESGLPVEPVLNKIFDIGVHFIPPHEDTTQHYHYDVRFYLRATEDKPFTVSEESHDLKWIEREEQLPNNYCVQRMFRKWKNMKRKNIDISTIHKVLASIFAFVCTGCIHQEHCIVPTTHQSNSNSNPREKASLLDPKLLAAYLISGDSEAPAPPQNVQFKIESQDLPWDGSVKVLEKHEELKGTAA
jgi:hypothetical protein